MSSTPNTLYKERLQKGLSVAYCSLGCTEGQAVYCTHGGHETLANQRADSKEPDRKCIPGLLVSRFRSFADVSGVSDAVRAVDVSVLSGSVPPSPTTHAAPLTPVESSGWRSARKKPTPRLERKSRRELKKKRRRKEGRTRFQ